MTLEGRVSSQGLNATLLGWSSLFGLSSETRARLGYHKLGSGQTASMQSYARDKLYGPVQELTKMLEAMSEGKFCPDGSEKFPDFPEEIPDPSSGRMRSQVEIPIWLSI